MHIEKPYRRIYRPETTLFSGGDFENNYIVDQRNTKDLWTNYRAMRLLEKDIHLLFEFVEPANENANCFSSRSYDLLIRACTEFESQCKIVLISNGYNKKGNFNILDYYKLNKAMRLSEYSVHYSFWRDTGKTFYPFKQWEKDHTLSWFQDYNKVKHNRFIEFQKANIINLMLAFSGLLCLLYAQFGFYGITTASSISRAERGVRVSDTPFWISPPNWEHEHYNFEWKKLVTFPDPYKFFDFK